MALVWVHPHLIFTAQNLEDPTPSAKGHRGVNRLIFCFLVLPKKFKMNVNTRISDFDML